MSPVEQRMRAVLPRSPLPAPRLDICHRVRAEMDVEHLLLRHTPPGPGLVAEIDDSTACDLAELDDATVLEALAAAERQIAALQARRFELLAEWARRHTRTHVEGEWVTERNVDGLSEFAAPEVAARLTWTDACAGERLDVGRRLATCLPVTLRLLRTGQIDEARALVIYRGTALLSEEAAAAVDAAVAEDAPELTTGRLRRRVLREAAAVDPANTARRAENGRRLRSVRTWPLPDGQAELAVTGPAGDVHTIYTAINGLAADRDPTDPRDGEGADARRFDALVDLAQTVLDDAAGLMCSEPDSVRRRRQFRGAKPHLTVVVHESTLDGADDDPAELEGYGPIPADHARALAAAGGPRRTVVVDDAGVLVAIANTTTTPPGEGGSASPSGESPPGESLPGGSPPGGSPPRTAPPSFAPANRDASRWQVDDRHATAACPRDPITNLYRPCRAVDRLVRMRDARCTYPGCCTPAVRCDLDHVLRHPDGPTCPCNLHPLCRRHHRMKHQTRTTVTRRADGSITWRLPAGHSYIRRPEPVLPRPTVRSVKSEPVPLVDVARTDDGAAGYLALTHALWPPEVREEARRQPKEPAPSRYDGPPPF